MLKKMWEFTLAVIVLSLLFALPACSGSSNSPSNLPEPAYAGAITESVLLAMNDGDYAKFSRDFDDAMQKAIPEPVFNQQIITGVKGKIGNYVANSKIFLQAAYSSGDTVMAYQTQFTGEPAGVVVTISFKDINGRPYVDGLFFNSAKLRGG